MRLLKAFAIWFAFAGTGVGLAELFFGGVLYGVPYALTILGSLLLGAIGGAVGIVKAIDYYDPA